MQDRANARMCSACAESLDRGTGLEVDFKNGAERAQALFFSSLFSKRVNPKSSYLVFYLFFLVSLSFQEPGARPHSTTH
jgi:hypothetical protein